MEFIAALSAVGSKVRVWDEGRESSRLAIIATLDAGKYDVLFVDGTDEEEGQVSLSRLAVPEDWELDDGEREELVSAGVMKDRANSLFTKHKDVLAAEKLYMKALSKVSPCAPFSVGTTVLLLPRDQKTRVNLLSATVADLEAGQYDVLLDSVVESNGEDEEEEEEEEEQRVPAQRIAAALAAGAEERELQRSLWINVARCLLKRCQFGWTVRFASLALACSKCTGHAKGTADGLAVRCKSLLAACKPKAALRDCHELAARGDSRGATLQRECEAFLRDRQRSNRQMAKDIAQWADRAMRVGGHLGSLGSGSGGQVALEEDDGGED